MPPGQQPPEVRSVVWCVDRDQSEQRRTQEMLVAPSQERTAAERGAEAGCAGPERGALAAGQVVPPVERWPPSVRWSRPAAYLQDAELTAVVSVPASRSPNAAAELSPSAGPAASGPGPAASLARWVFNTMVSVAATSSSEVFDHHRCRHRQRLQTACCQRDQPPRCWSARLNRAQRSDRGPPRTHRRSPRWTEAARSFRFRSPPAPPATEP